jgi:hypothetical protein
MSRLFTVTSSNKHCQQFQTPVDAMDYVKSKIWMSKDTESRIWNDLVLGKDTSVVYGFTEVHIAVKGGRK